VQKATLPSPCNIPTDAEISICFERGGKVAKSKNYFIVINSDKSGVINFEESLSLVATMYKNNDGVYMVTSSSLLHDHLLIYLTGETRQINFTTEKKEYD
jgi:hypothetical protein